MDPITAIGLASAVITFVGAAAKITKRIRELSEAGDIPEVFRDIKTRLPLIISIIVRMQDETDDLSLQDEAAFEEVVRQCYGQVGQLDEILRKVVITKSDSRLKKAVRASISLVEEGRVQRIAMSLRDNVQLLTLLNVTPAEKRRPQTERRPSEPLPYYVSTTGLFLVPFSRDERFVGRDNELSSITSSFENQRRVALSGIGGIGKSQVAIEFCYRFQERNPDAHVLWIYGGNIARFYQGYKRIAQLLELPGWDDPEQSILELVCSSLSNSTVPYLLVIDNADNIEHWWPCKYKSGGSLDDPAQDLSKYLPTALDHSHLLITTRDSRVAGRLTKEAKPIVLLPMSNEEAISLFYFKFANGESTFIEAEVRDLLRELDFIPLAVSQAAAFIEENGISITDYRNALRGEEAEEFLYEELNDSRRDEESVNSVFRTWRLSFDEIKRHKPRAAELLSLIAMLDRQSIPRSLLKVPEVTTSLSVLQALNLVTTRAGKQSFQIHRLVQMFVQISLRRDHTAEKWQEAALALVAQDYPIVIGVAEWPICDALAPHVHALTSYKFKTAEARIDLAHLLCWAADFDIERGLYIQALQRAEQSLFIFQQLVPEHDERLAAATWLCGRLRYYQAQSTSDMDAGAELLRNALSISQYPSMNFAESAFELAHLYYDQGKEAPCLEMGKASFKCWEDMEGPNNIRTLDNMHDYALELAMLGREEDGISRWQEILERCPASDASENTKTVYTYRSLASITEFQGDPAMAEIFYAKLITLCEAIYTPDHIHVFDYRLSHAEQIMRQGRLEEATQLSESILAHCNNLSEWRISASALQTIAECWRLKACYSKEEYYREGTLKIHEKRLGYDHRETIDAEQALADCLLNCSRPSQVEKMYRRIQSWRNKSLGESHIDTVRTVECLGVYYAFGGQDAEAETAFKDAICRQTDADERLLGNLYSSLWNQSKWESLEYWTRKANVSQPNPRRNLMIALEEQGKVEEAMVIRTSLLALEWPDKLQPEGRRLPTLPPPREDRRFGRMIHPRTWSA